MMKRAAVVLCFVVVLACNNPGPPPPHTAISDDEKRNELKGAPVVATISTGLAAPESALYDPQQDIYFISNMNGALLDRDNNGFISRVDAKTMQVNVKWIEGGKNNVTLDAPKGMAIVGETLYVSDVTAVRKFDRRSGAPQGEIPIAGATTINDLTTDGRKIFVSDTGVIPGPGQTFEATGTDSIWMIENDRATKIASGTDLQQPNGLQWADGKLYAITFMGNQLYELDNGKKTDVNTLPREELDGVVRAPDGTFFVSSWKGMAIYRSDGKDAWTPILQNIPTPADLGYDSTRHLLLVPASSLNRVTLHKLSSRA